MTAAPVTTTVEKKMTLSAGEFAKSMTAFAGDEVVIHNGSAVVAVNEKGGHAAIAYVRLPPRRVGGLLELPQAMVTITLTKVSAAEAEDFLRRFDFAFQRGGG